MHHAAGMTLIGLLVTLVVLGVILYVVNRVIPMDGNIKLIVNAIVIIAILLWVAQCFGVFTMPPLNRRIG